MFYIYQLEQNADNYSAKSVRVKQPLILTFIYKPKKFLEIKLEPKIVLKISLLLVIALVIFSTTGQLYQYILANGNESRLIKLFYLGYEKNVPTAYSSLSLLCCSLLLAIIARSKNIHRDRYRGHWLALSLIFLYLAIDEAISIHEKSMDITRDLLNTGGFFYYAWIIPAIFLLGLFILIYLKFIRSLPQKTRFLFLFAGMLFVIGAIGMEMVGGKIFVMQGENQKSLIYAMVATIEETLEMMGTAVFIYALLRYIKNYISYSNLRVVLKR